MDNEALQTIDIRRILALAPVIDEYSLGTDFILGEVSGKQVEKSQAILSMLKYPIRFMLVNKKRQNTILKWFCYLFAKLDKKCLSLQMK